MGVGAMRAGAVCFLGLLSFASAQCASPTKTLRSLKEVNDFKCPSFSGTLLVQSFTLTRNLETPTPSIVLGSLQEVQGGSLEFSDIHVINEFSRGVGQDAETARSGPDFRPGALNISAPKLGYVLESLSFDNIPDMTMPHFPALATVAEIAFSSVGFSNQTQFGTEQFGYLTNLQTLSFMGTSVTRIGPLADELKPPDGGNAGFIALKNSELVAIEFTGASPNDGYMEIDIEDNKLQPSVSFDNIEAGSIVLSEVRSFEAPNLQQLFSTGQGKDQSIDGSSLLTISLPSLTTITGTLEIEGNQKLSSLNLTALTAAGDLKIEYNPNLSSVTINPSNGGGVSGDISIDSSGSFNCNSLRQKLPNAKVTCPTSSSQSSPSASPGSTSPGSSSSSGLSTGAKAGIGVGVGLGALLVIGAVIFFCCRRRRDKSYSTREISSEPYSKSQHSYTESGEMAYSKVPFNPGGEAGGVSEPHSEEHTPTSALAHNWTPPERDVPSTQDRVELEEQQGTRHEMDARSLPDMDSEDDEEADTRSLEDIERIHRER